MSDTDMSSHSVVRFNYRSETGRHPQLLSRLARADVWYASAFTRGSFPRNLLALLGWKSAKRTHASFFRRVEKAESFILDSITGTPHSQASMMLIAFPF